MSQAVVSSPIAIELLGITKPSWHRLLQRAEIKPRLDCIGPGPRLGMWWTFTDLLAMKVVLDFKRYGTSYSASRGLHFAIIGRLDRHLEDLDALRDKALVVEMTGAKSPRTQPNRVTLRPRKNVGIPVYNPDSSDPALANVAYHVVPLAKPYDELRPAFDAAVERNLGTQAFESLEECERSRNELAAGSAA